MTGEQKRKILKHLIYNGELSSLEAMTKLGIGRLASRVSELRKEGFDLPMERRKKADGSGWYGVYSLSANDLDKIANGDYRF